MPFMENTGVPCTGTFFTPVYWTVPEETYFSLLYYSLPTIHFQMPFPVQNYHSSIVSLSPSLCPEIRRGTPRCSRARCPRDSSQLEVSGKPLKEDVQDPRTNSSALFDEKNRSCLSFTPFYLEVRRPAKQTRESVRLPRLHCCYRNLHVVFHRAWLYVLASILYQKLVDMLRFVLKLSAKSNDFSLCCFSDWEEAHCHFSVCQTSSLAQSAPCNLLRLPPKID